MANDLLGRIEEWRRKLLDLTNRNQLVSCKIGPRAAIPLEYPSPDQVWSGLLGGADLTFARNANWSTMRTSPVMTTTHRRSYRCLHRKGKDRHPSSNASR